MSFIMSAKCCVHHIKLLQVNGVGKRKHRHQIFEGIFCSAWESWTSYSLILGTAVVNEQNLQLIYFRQMNIQHLWKYRWQRKLNYSEDSLSQFNFLRHKSHLGCLGILSGSPQWEDDCKLPQNKQEKKEERNRQGSKRYIHLSRSKCHSGVSSALSSCMR